MKIFFTLLFLTLSLFSMEGVEVTQSYYVDKNASFTLSDALHAKQQFIPVQTKNLGVTSSIVWTKIVLRNTTENSKTLKLFNPRAGMDFIDAYIIKEDHVIEHYKLGDQLQQNEVKDPYRLPCFDVILQGGKTVTIITKNRSFGAMEIKWQVQCIQCFYEGQNAKASLYAFLSGAILILALLSLSYYYAHKKAYYLYYALYILLLIIYQIALMGYFYELGLSPYINTLLTFLLPGILIFLIGYFPLSFFNIFHHKQFILMRRLLLTLSWSALLLASVVLFYPLNYSLLYVYTLIDIVALFVVLSVTLFSIIMYRRSQTDAFYYVVSNILLLLSVLVFTAGTIGLIPANFFFYYSLPIGALSQVGFIGVALSLRAMKQRKENIKNIELLHEYSKLTFVGQTFINIYHQWKTPLNAIANSINHIQLAKEMKDSGIDKICSDNLDHMTKQIAFIKGTATNYLDYYGVQAEKVITFSINEALHEIVAFIESEVLQRNISIEIKCNDDYTLKKNRIFFDNILMVLFSNSIAIFEQRRVTDPIISITVTQELNKTTLYFSDNGGGIESAPLDKIFDKESTMHSTGIGLYLARNTLAEKLNGKITAQNSDKGAVFIVTIVN